MKVWKRSAKLVSNMTIKEAREAAGLSQRGMSDLLGIPKRTIQNWETGQRVPPSYVERLVLEKLLDIANDE